MSKTESLELGDYHACCTGDCECEDRGSCIDKLCRHISMMANEWHLYKYQAELLRKKVAHGCTDATCKECDE